MSNEANNPASCQTAVSGSAFSIHDLKCGNILNYDTSEGEILPTVIDWQDLKWLTEDPKGFNLVHSPIFLNSEWLLKFGFKEQVIENDIYFIYKDSLFAIWNVNDEFNNYFECGKLIYCDSFYSECISTLEFVHQLQNLHYSLTGEMLSLS